MAIRKKNDEPSGLVRGSGFNYGDAGTNPKGCGKYTTDDSGLTNKMPADGTGKSHDLMDNVEKNSTAGSGAVRYGVD